MEKIDPEKYFSKDYFFGRKNSNYHNYNHWDNDGYWNSTIKKIKKYKIQGRVLDMGCAFGFLLKRLQPFFKELFGADISTFALEQAKKEAPFATLNKIDLNKDQLPYPDNYFDLITAFDVLEHTQSIEKSMEKITEKLSPSGFLIINVPIKNTWASKLISLFDKDKSHASVLSERELVDILNKLNLKIVEKSYFLNIIISRIKGIPVDIELVLQKNNVNDQNF